MIQDEQRYIKLLEGIDLDDNENIILIIKNKGANQMTCTKVLMKLKRMRLIEANEIVQNSKHWINFKEGNESIKNRWFCR